MLTRSDIQTNNVIWNLGPNDDSFLGDISCSFIGSLKNFKYITGSSNFLINNENCDKNIKLSLGMKANYTHTLLSANTTSCASGQYFSTFMTCESCVNNCQTCLNATMCTTCIISYYVVPDGSCSLTCPDTSYVDTISGTCLSCPIGCNICTNFTFCT